MSDTHGPVRRLVERAMHAVDAERDAYAGWLNGTRLEQDVTSARRVMIDVCAAADALDASPSWPQGEQAAEQLARARYELMHYGTEWEKLSDDAKRAWREQEAAVLQRLAGAQGEP